MSQKIAPQALKIGLDLDGVVLYNPARTIRPIVKYLKSKIFGQKKTKFYIPKSKIGEFFWIAVHKSSMFQADGLYILDTLVTNQKAVAYIITARFKCLQKDTDKWFQKINQRNIIKKLITNKKSLQPHQYKYQTIKKLNLDIFIEDNWDIVSFLAKKQKEGKIDTHTLWVSNVLDYNIKYPYKHTSLKSALKAVARYSASKNAKDLMPA